MNCTAYLHKTDSEMIIVFNDMGVVLYDEPALMSYSFDSGWCPIDLESLKKHYVKAALTSATEKALYEATGLSI